jgi:heptosyltransferase-2
MTTRIALIKTGALGDVVRTTSLVPALRRRLGDVDIVWITSHTALPLVAGNGSVRAVAIDGPATASWRHDRYDWIISLDDEVESCAAATALHGDRLSGAYIDADGRRAYSSDLAAWFGMGILRPDALGGLAAANQMKRDNTRTYGELLYDGLGLALPVAAPSVRIPPSAHHAADEWLVNHGVAGVPLVGLNTGASGRWRFKSWGIDATSSLAQRLVDRGWTVLVLGGHAEAERNTAICERAAHARVVAGPTGFDVLSFAALVCRCDALVCSDSLAMHLAIAGHVPVVAVFGPTSAAEIDLVGLGEKLVAPVPCTRCYLPTCHVAQTCMQMITPEMVFARRPLRRLPIVSEGAA